MSVLYIIDINLVVSLCTDYTLGGELVNWKWSHSGGEIGNLLGTWRGKVEGHVGAPSNCLHSTKGIYAQKHLYHIAYTMHYLLCHLQPSKIMALALGMPDKITIPQNWKKQKILSEKIP